MGSTGESTSQPDGQAYLEQRRILYEGEVQAQRDKSKWLLGISSGAFGLSVTIIDKASFSKAGYVLLILSWLALVITILVEILCLHYAAEAFEKFREILDCAYYKSQGNERWWDVCRKQQAEHPLLTRIERLNLISVWAFMSGILLLGIFALVNLPK